jgi:ribonuclease BN (tRNA processing enzyme)
MKMTVIGHWGAYPEANGATSGYLFQSEGFNMLIDCGSAVVSKLQNFIDIEDLDAVVLSHYHQDHFADIGPLQYGVLVKRLLGKVDKPLPIYGHTFDEKAFSLLHREGDTVGIAYDPDESLFVGPFEIRFFKTKHPVPCFAMKITDRRHTIVYSADMSFDENFSSFATGCELLISECSFYANQDGAKAGHLNSLDAATIASQSGAAELLLTHLPHFGNPNDLIKEAQSIYAGPIDLAKSGWVWEAKGRFSCFPS